MPQVEETRKGALISNRGGLLLCHHAEKLGAEAMDLPSQPATMADLVSSCASADLVNESIGPATGYVTKKGNGWAVYCPFDRWQDAAGVIFSHSHPSFYVVMLKASLACNLRYYHSDVSGIRIVQAVLVLVVRRGV